MSFVILIVLIVLLIAAAPAWPYSRKWGYFPTGGIGAAILIVLILLMLGMLPGRV